MQCLSVISDRLVDLADLVESEPSVEDRLEVLRIQLDGLVIIVDCLFELLLLSSLPAVRMQDIGLSQGCFSRQVGVGKAYFVVGRVLRAIGTVGLSVQARIRPVPIDEGLGVPLNENFGVALGHVTGVYF